MFTNKNAIFLSVILKANIVVIVCPADVHKRCSCAIAAVLQTQATQCSATKCTTHTNQRRTECDLEMTLSRVTYLQIFFIKHVAAIRLD